MKCQCSDPGCPVHPKRSFCVYKANMRVFRMDTEDQTGTPMCDYCAEDAIGSGLFDSEPLENKARRNAGIGERMTFHGAFKSAALAERKKARTRNAYVIVRKISGQTRYVVVSPDTRAIQKARYAKRSAMNPVELGYRRKKTGKGYAVSLGVTRSQSNPNPNPNPNPKGDTLIYSRAISIVAAKGRGHRCDSDCLASRHTYKHNFDPGVRIIGLKNGDVLLSKR